MKQAYWAVNNDWKFLLSKCNGFIGTGWKNNTAAVEIKIQDLETITMDVDPEMMPQIKQYRNFDCIVFSLKFDLVEIYLWAMCHVFSLQHSVCETLCSKLVDCLIVCPFGQSQSSIIQKSIGNWCSYDILYCVIQFSKWSQIQHFHCFENGKSQYRSFHSHNVKFRIFNLFCIRISGL